MELEGTGTQEDPIIITGNNIPLKLLISKINFYLTIKDLNLTTLTLYRCKNIIVEDCRIHDLVLNRCQHVTAKNNSIMKVETVFSRANAFEGNEIRCIKNRNYEDSHFEVFFYFSIVFGLGLLFSAVINLVNLNLHWLTIYFLVMGSMIIGSVSNILKINFQIRKLNPNEFHDNTSISQLRQVFYHNYQQQVIP